MRKFCILLLTVLLTCSLAAPTLAADKPATAAKTALIDINTATAAELKTLSGIGDAYAAKIIAGRPYTRKDQLKAKKIIPTPTYDKIQDKLVARQ